MQLPLKNALGFATATFAALFTDFRPLLRAYLLPAIIMRFISLANIWLAARAAVPVYFPAWVIVSLHDILFAAVWVAVIRYLVIAEDPKWVASKLPWRAVAIMAIILIVMWRAIDAVSDSHMLYGLYLNQRGLDAPYGLDAGRRVMWLIHFYGFTLSCLMMALVYPLLGRLAVRGRLETSSWIRWQKGNFPSILAVTVILCACVQMLDQLYIAGLHAILPRGFWDKPAGLAWFDGWHEIMKQCLLLIINFFYVVVPPVAIALLMKGLDRQGGEKRAS